MLKTRSLFAWALMASAAVCAAVAAVTVPIAQAVVATARAFKDFVLDGFKLAGGEDEGEAQPAVMLVQAKAFVLRLAKRERPEVSGSWRMCPST